MDQPVAKHECLACAYTDFRMSTKSVGNIVPEGCPKCDGDMVISSRDELPGDLEKVGDLVDEWFFIWDFQVNSERMSFIVDSDKTRKSFSGLFKDLKEIGYVSRVSSSDGEILLKIIKAPEIEHENVLINVILLIATIGTTFGVAGYYFLYHDLLSASLFSGSLMTILSAHEMGHKIAAWRHDVEVSWPYFIPVPPPWIGTLGAVIRTKSPIPTKEGLVEMGSSGPIMGFLFAVPIAAIGLALSQPVGGEMFQRLPAPLIYALLGFFKFGHFPAGLNPHPFAWAGFIGLLVTWLNLMPAGQLDGGHVSRGLLGGRNHFLLTRLLAFGLILSSFFWPPLLIWGILILFLFGRRHPGALNNVSDLRKEQMALAFVTMMIFIITVPMPTGLF